MIEFNSTYLFNNSVMNNQSINELKILQWVFFVFYLVSLMANSVLLFVFYANKTLQNSSYVLIIFLTFNNWISSLTQVNFVIAALLNQR